MMSHDLLRVLWGVKAIKYERTQKTGNDDRDEGTLTDTIKRIPHEEMTLELQILSSLHPVHPADALYLKNVQLYHA